MNKNFALLFALAGMSIVGCKSDSEPAVKKVANASTKGAGQADACSKLGLVAEQATVAAPVWSGNIEPLIKTNCAGCHSANGTPPNLSTFAAAKAAGVDSLEQIEAGKMPPSKKLAAADIATIKAWTEGGMPEKSSASTGDTGAGSGSGAVSNPATTTAGTEDADTSSDPSGAPKANETGTEGDKAAAKTAEADPCTTKSQKDDPKDPKDGDAKSEKTGGTDTASGTEDSTTGTATSGSGDTGDSGTSNTGTTTRATNRPIVSDNPLMKNSEVEACFKQGKIYDRRPSIATCIADSKFSTYSCDWAGVAKALGDPGNGEISKLLATYVADSWKLDQCGELGEKGTPIVFLVKEEADKSIKIRVLKPKEQ